MNTKTTILTLVVMVLSATAMADWMEGMPAKWVQLPDFTCFQIFSFGT